MSSIPPFIEEGRLEALAAIESEERKKLDAEAVAQSCANRFGYVFETVKITEQVQGRYRSENANGNAVILAEPANRNDKE